MKILDHRMCLMAYSIILTTLAPTLGSISFKTNYDLSESYPEFQHQVLPPGQLDLVTSRPPGKIFLSRGCQSTELRLKCPAHKVLIIESALFSPAHWNPVQFIKKLNCSSQTKHSEAAEGGVILKPMPGDKDMRQALNRRCSGNQRESGSWGRDWRRSSTSVYPKKI